MPISSEKYQPTLEVERSTPGSFDIDGFRQALRSKEMAGVLTEGTEPETIAALTALVEQANLHGLEATDFNHALAEIKEQLDIEGSAIARHEFDREKRGTSLLNIPRQIGLRWQSMLETFGRGKIAERAKQQRRDRLQDREYIAGVAQAAIERASLRKRYHEYIRLAGSSEFSAILDEYRSGIVTRERVLAAGEFQDGIESILTNLTVPDPFKFKDPSGADVEIPLTPETERVIKNHLRFLLQDEVLQLTQLSQMKVMQTEAYHVDQKSVGTIAAKLLGSGTLWGMTVRTGGRLAVGGSIAAASFAATPAGWGVIGAAIGVGAVAGFASQVAEYKFARRKQKKMDLAIGASQATIKHEISYISGPDATRHEETRLVEVSKPAEQINAALKTKVDLLRQLSTEIEGGEDKYAELGTVLKDAYTVLMDAEWRLVASQRGEKDQHDYIAFGLDNRLKATLELTQNLKEASRAISTAKDIYIQRNGFLDDPAFEADLSMIARYTKGDIAEVQHQLESVLMRGEWKRRIFGAALGGTFAGLSAAAMDYIHDWFGNKNIDVSEPPTFQTQSELLVNHSGEDLIIKPDAAGDLVIQNSDGVQQVIDLPAGVDAQQVVVTPELDIYNAATGEPVGHINVDLAPAIAETLKTPQLDATLTIDHSQLVTTQGKTFGLVVDKDGNLALYNVKPDNSIDVSQPVVAPANIISTELHAQIDALGTEAGEKTMQAVTQLQVETQSDGTILVKSIYDQSVIAKFNVDASGAVTVPEPPAPVPTPASTAELLDRLFTDPNSDAAKLLNKMGVQAGEITKQANGEFDIANDVVKGEYLGNTEGWRQVRMELLLKATQEGKISNGESADMIVARLERATRHLLLEGGKYPDANAAMAEAFGKDANFIQQSELPWINGPKSLVSNDWEKLVDAMRNLPDQTTTTTPVPSTVVPGASAPVSEPTVAVHPISPDTVFNPAKPEGMSGNFVADQASSFANKGAISALDLGLAVAGLTLEQTLRPSHLVGAEQAITPGFGSKLDAFTFAKAPEKPKPVDPVEAATEAYENSEIRLESKLAELAAALQDLRSDVWPNHTTATRRELNVLDRSQEIIDIVDRLRMRYSPAELAQVIPGKTFNTLEEYMDRAAQAGRDGMAEVQTEAKARARWAKNFIDTSLTQLDTNLASTDKVVIGNYLDHLRKNQPYAQGVVHNLQDIFTGVVLTELSGIQSTVANMESAISRLEARLTELAATPAPAADPEPIILDPTEEAGAAEEAEDPADAAQRRTEFLANQAEATLRLEVKDRYEQIDAILADRLEFQYIDHGHANVLDVIANEMVKQGIFDQAHVAPFFVFLSKVEGERGDRLWRSKMMKAGGEADEVVIKKMVEKFREHPDQNPFVNEADSASARLADRDTDF